MRDGGVVPDSTRPSGPPSPDVKMSSFESESSTTQSQQEQHDSTPPPPPKVRSLDSLYQPLLDQLQRGHPFFNIIRNTVSHLQAPTQLPSARRASMIGSTTGRGTTTRPASRQPSFSQKDGKPRDPQAQNQNHHQHQHHQAESKTIMLPQPGSAEHLLSPPSVKDYCGIVINGVEGGSRHTDVFVDVFPYVQEAVRGLHPPGTPQQTLRMRALKRLVHEEGRTVRELGVGMFWLVLILVFYKKEGKLEALRGQKQFWEMADEFKLFRERKLKALSELRAPLPKHWMQLVSRIGTLSQTLASRRLASLMPLNTSGATQPASAATAGIVSYSEIRRGVRLQTWVADALPPILSQALYRLFTALFPNDAADIGEDFLRALDKIVHFELTGVRPSDAALAELRKRLFIAQVISAPHLKPMQAHDDVQQQQQQQQKGKEQAARLMRGNTASIIQSTIAPLGSSEQQAARSSIEGSAAAPGGPFEGTSHRPLFGVQLEFAQMDRQPPRLAMRVLPIRGGNKSSPILTHIQEDLATKQELFSAAPPPPSSSQKRTDTSEESEQECPVGYRGRVKLRTKATEDALPKVIGLADEDGGSDGDGGESRGRAASARQREKKELEREIDTTGDARSSSGASEAGRSRRQVSEAPAVHTPVWGRSHHHAVLMVGHRSVMKRQTPAKHFNAPLSPRRPSQQPGGDDGQHTEATKSQKSTARRSSRRHTAAPQWEAAFFSGQSDPLDTSPTNRKAVLFFDEGVGQSEREGADGGEGGEGRGDDDEAAETVTLDEAAASGKDPYQDYLAVCPSLLTHNISPVLAQLLRRNPLETAGARNVAARFIGLRGCNSAPSLPIALPAKTSPSHPQAAVTIKTHKPPLPPVSPKALHTAATGHSSSLHPSSTDTTAQSAQAPPPPAALPAKKGAGAGIAMDRSPTGHHVHHHHQHQVQRGGRRRSVLDQAGGTWAEYLRTHDIYGNPRQQHDFELYKREAALVEREAEQLRDRKVVQAHADLLRRQAVRDRLAIFNKKRDECGHLPMKLIPTR
ncbi:unnamed protein product [Vitrella brassicaformis CCMP3155]|uniref:Uncharacterized protein n=3 Tax=Vitrella brassicaformis TaxID=1169539 RepID=A0A0G4GPJ9_VITBC|nr:unnamed protein product [Vitrella brassicaformis CCMP3155]|eukprot:CEM32286.1 unnamed protein product [Vitrella brassicaformis CCMP3155]